jgi:two-component system, LuxR family, response regulator FixJ
MQISPLSRSRRNRVQVVEGDVDSASMIRRLSHAEAFDVDLVADLDAFPWDDVCDHPTCVVSDWLGREALQRLCRRAPPVIVVALNPSVRNAVEAMRCGVHDSLLQPLTPAELMICLRSGWTRHQSRLAERRWRAAMSTQLTSLTGRELEVLKHLLQGENVKRVAGDLTISPKTVEFHRQRILAKLACDNLVELTGALLRAWYGKEEPWSEITRSLMDA